jgi:hypothetical protein
MDSAVDQTMSRSTTEQGADKAANLRRSQSRERTALQNDISKAQKEITILQEQRAPIASEMRKVEAEVGPIKYIAALIYGDNPEANTLEKAVRWVIILIVIVFDPLALTLLLAATKTFEWERGVNVFNTKRKDDPFDNWTKEDFDAVNKSLKDAEEKEKADIILSHGVGDSTPADNQPLVEKKTRWAGFGFPMLSIFNKKEDPEIQEFFERAQDRAQAIDAGTYQAPEEPVEQSVITDGNDERPGDYLPKETVTELVEKEARRRWKEDNPNDTLHHQENLFSSGAIKKLPWFDSNYYIGLETDNSPNGPTGEVKGFGILFPKDVVKGDMYLRVDQIPSVLYKFNGRNWIEVDKNLSDQHAYNDAYIDHLISKIESGEYDPDLLSNAERDSIERRLG